MAGHHEHDCLPVFRSLRARRQIREQMITMRTRKPIPSPSRVLRPWKLLSANGIFSSVFGGFELCNKVRCISRHMHFITYILKVYLYRVHGSGEHVKQLINAFKFPHCRTCGVPLATHTLMLDKVREGVDPITPKKSHIH